VVQVAFGDTALEIQFVLALDLASVFDYDQQRIKS
jgi:hypothetical protein